MYSNCRNVWIELFHTIPSQFLMSRFFYGFIQLGELLFLVPYDFIQLFFGTRRKKISTTNRTVVPIFLVCVEILHQLESYRKLEPNINWFTLLTTRMESW